MSLSPESLAKIQEILQSNPGAVLEHVARDAGVTTAAVLSCLPKDQVSKYGAEFFEKVMAGISQLGKITFIVHTEDIVMECKGTVPEGSYGRGYFNIHGDSPLSGHIKADNCDGIYFVSRNLMGRESHSIQFYNKNGECMYKVYLGRDENRELIPEQIDKFKNLKEHLA